jgi:hypothetical protein
MLQIKKLSAMANMATQIQTMDFVPSTVKLGMFKSRLLLGSFGG